jgi:hypothetical protein
MRAAGADGQSVRSVDDVVKGLRDVGAERGPGNSQAIAAALDQALSKMQKVEYDLRKKVDTGNEQLFLSGSDEVPSQYRPAVESYYRALSKKNGGQPAPAPASTTTPAKPKGRGGM